MPNENELATQLGSSSGQGQSQGQSQGQIAISDQQQAMERSIIDTDGGGFIKDLRIKSKSSDITGSPGDWVFGGNTVVAKIGEPLEVHIGVWRYQAWRFQGKTLEIKSHNLTEGSKFRDGNWELNDTDKRVGTIHTPDFFTVMVGGVLGNIKALAKLNEQFGAATVEQYRAKAKANSGVQLRNLVGFCHLLYIPSINEWTVYFISGQAKTQTNVYQDLRRFQGGVGVLLSKKGAGQYEPMIPEFRSVPGQQAKFPADFDAMFEKFLFECVDQIVDPNARPR